MLEKPSSLTKKDFFTSPRTSIAEFFSLKNLIYIYIHIYKHNIYRRFLLLSDTIWMYHFAMYMGEV